MAKANEKVSGTASVFGVQGQKHRSPRCTFWPPLGLASGL